MHLTLEKQGRNAFFAKKRNGKTFNPFRLFPLEPSDVGGREGKVNYDAFIDIIDNHFALLLDFLTCLLLTRIRRWNTIMWQFAILKCKFLLRNHVQTIKHHARINVRLATDLKHLVEEAAAALGQTVSDFTVSTIVREARQVLQEAQITELSNRDRDAFLAALDAKDAKPNDALKAAARRYKKRVK